MNLYPWLDAYLLSKPGAQKDYKAEWGWHRYMVDGKMFAATCLPGPEYKAHAGREMVILKCEPVMAQLLREQFADVVPGFYCNKDNWNSVYLDGSVPEEELRHFCDLSYQLVFAKLTKKRQKEISEG